MLHVLSAAGITVDNSISFISLIWHTLTELSLQELYVVLMAWTRYRRHHKNKTHTSTHTHLYTLLN